MAIIPGAESPPHTIAMTHLHSLQATEPSASAVYRRVAQAIDWLRAHAHLQPGLDEVAHALGCSPFHLQRQFSEWAGVSPKRFVQYLTKEHARARLAANTSVLEAALDVGLSGPGRLHDLMLTWEAMTPGEVKAGGAGLTVSHAWMDTPFGDALLGWIHRGVCHLAFAADDSADARAHAEAELRQLWPCAHHHPAPQEGSAWAHKLFPWQNRPASGKDPDPQPIHLLMRGSPFQLQVWQALVRTQPGHVCTYQTLAQTVGKPGAARAVGSAMAANTLALLIPCHRVIRANGEEGGYRWGPTRKAALLAWESAKCDAKNGLYADDL